MSVQSGLARSLTTLGTLGLEALQSQLDCRGSLGREKKSTHGIGEIRGTHPHTGLLVIARTYYSGHDGLYISKWGGQEHGLGLVREVADGALTLSIPAAGHLSELNLESMLESEAHVGFQAYVEIDRSEGDTAQGGAGWAISRR